MAHALDLVGERWALLVIRELLLGPKRFTDLRSGLPGISPNILTLRLRELDEAGIVRHGTLPPPASHQIGSQTVIAAAMWVRPQATMNGPKAMNAQMKAMAPPEKRPRRTSVKAMTT